MKITLEDDATGTTIKHKQSDLSSQEEVIKLRSQDSDQNQQRHRSPQHTRGSNKELSPAGSVREQILFAAEMYGAGPQVKSAPGTSLSSENQHIVEKDFTSQRSPESSNTNL